MFKWFVVVDAANDDEKCSAKFACCWFVVNGEGEDESELVGDEEDPQEEPEEIDLVKDPGCSESPIPPDPLEGDKTWRFVTPAFLMAVAKHANRWGYEININ